MPYIKTVKQFISVLRQARRDQGLTQAQLGDKVGMSQKKVAMIENHAASPRLDTLLVIAAALGLHLSINDGKEPEHKIDLVWD